MPEPIYPVTCRSCSKPLYGPVTYCPFCGDVSSAVETEVVTKVAEPVLDTPRIEREVEKPSPIKPDETPLPQAGKTEPALAEKDAPEIKTTKPVVGPATEQKSSVQDPSIAAPAPAAAPATSVPQATHATPFAPVPPQAPKFWKWVAVAALLVVVFAGYRFSHKKAGAAPDPSVSQGSSGPASPASTPASEPGQGKKDSARVVAQDALRKGTDLSLTVSKIPKLVKVLEAAKQLGDISPRYQEQVASAESTVSSARRDLNRGVLAYIGKIAELESYSPEQKSYAMQIILKGDLAPREKVVAELLQKHADSSRNGSKLGPKKMLNDFTSRFNDFTD